MKKKPTKKVPRNGSALAAMSRKGGPMKHRLEPKGGATNSQTEALKHLPDAEECHECGGTGMLPMDPEYMDEDMDCPACGGYKREN